MLSTCVKGTVFQFKDDFYQQVSGLAMGGSISAVLSNLVMEHFELNALSTIPFLIFLYKRYVDDKFLIVKRGEENSILQFFNSLNPSIQFTMEVEKDGVLNYLDMSVIRVGNKLKCKWYQKPTSSGRYSNFLSVQPTNIKRNVALNLARRMIFLSDRSFRNEVVRKGKQLLIENCYPPLFVDGIFKEILRCVNNRKNTRSNDTSRVDCSDDSVNVSSLNDTFKVDKVVPLPYVPFLSENLACFFKYFSYKVVHCRYNTLEFLMSKLKPDTPKLQSGGVVYQIPCADCDISYIGQTKQPLAKRLNGHKYDRREATALHNHEDQLQHKFDFENVKILCHEKRYFARLIREMIEILRNQDSVCNSRSDINRLSIIYHNLFAGRALLPSGGRPGK